MLKESVSSILELIELVYWPGRFSGITGNIGSHGNHGKFHKSHQILNQSKRNSNKICLEQIWCQKIEY